jgi:hypothetical protein
LYSGTTVTKDLLEVIPVKTTEGRSILLINKTEKTVSLQDGEVFLSNGNKRVMLQINEQGNNPVNIATINGQLVLPRFSTTLINVTEKNNP